jgi:hypothetical protein
LKVRAKERGLVVPVVSGDEFSGSSIPVMCVGVHSQKQHYQVRTALEDIMLRRLSPKVAGRSRIAKRGRWRNASRVAIEREQLQAKMARASFKKLI